MHRPNLPVVEIPTVSNQNRQSSGDNAAREPMKPITRHLAEKIAKMLFTPRNCNYKADHLQLVKNGKYISGWALGPATDVIESVIKSELAKLIGKL